jgi:hypothetical protein
MKRTVTTIYYQGLWDVITRRDLCLFSASELQLLVGGPREIDISELKKHMEYHRGASASHPTIARFWSIVEAMDTSTLRKLLTFWSGSSLPPMFGFQDAFDVKIYIYIYISKWNDWHICGTVFCNYISFVCLSYRSRESFFKFKLG